MDKKILFDRMYSKCKILRVDCIQLKNSLFTNYSNKLTLQHDLNKLKQTFILFRTLEINLECSPVFAIASLFFACSRFFTL